MMDRAPDTDLRVRHEPGDTVVVTGGRRAVMLTLATVGFAVNFWAWALLSPLGPRFKRPSG